MRRLVCAFVVRQPQKTGFPCIKAHMTLFLFKGYLEILGDSVMQHQIKGQPFYTNLFITLNILEHGPFYIDHKHSFIEVQHCINKSFFMTKKVF